MPQHVSSSSQNPQSLEGPISLRDLDFLVTLHPGVISILVSPKILVATKSCGQLVRGRAVDHDGSLHSGAIDPERA